jgi:GR25 family glycosyltransferase involved in LPS biosynthesis
MMYSEIMTYVINLEKRKDRLDNIKIHFKWKRFAAFPATPGYVGCLKSHQMVLKEAFELNLDKVIIFEDDVELCEDFELKFTEIMSKLPDDWDLLYLGGWNKGVIKEYCAGLNIAEIVVCMHAYIVRKKFLSIVLDALHSKDQLHPIEKKPNDYKCDVLLATHLNY